MHIRIPCKITHREQWKSYPITEHLDLLRSLCGIHNFTLISYKRKRDNYNHSIKYELKFIRPVVDTLNSIDNNYELIIRHDGYMDTEDLWEKLLPWCWRITTAPEQIGNDKTLDILVESLVSTN